MILRPRVGTKTSSHCALAGNVLRSIDRAKRGMLLDRRSRRVTRSVLRGASFSLGLFPREALAQATGLECLGFPLLGGSCRRSRLMRGQASQYKNLPDADRSLIVLPSQEISAYCCKKISCLVGFACFFSFIMVHSLCEKFLRIAARTSRGMRWLYNVIAICRS